MPCVYADVGTDYLLRHRSLAEATSPAATTSAAANAAPATNAPRAVAQKTSEAGANSLVIPGSILETGADVHSPTVSPNAVQLAGQLGILEALKHVQDLRGTVNASSAVGDRLDLLEARERVAGTLRRSEMDVNFVLSEIYDEQSLYADIMSNFTSQRDKTVAVTNAISFGTNGALWAVCEALDIPTYKTPTLSIPSGITGILAGIVPSIASALTLKEVNGRKYSAPAAPNMLAKVFDRPTTSLIEYPDSVWTFLNSEPVQHEANEAKRRREVIVDRWISDKNIPSFTDRSSKEQIDLVTASAEQKKTLTIAVLSTRITMLQQLASETYKMNRLLLELEMVLEGTKHF
jgi:hypothetical protein